MNTGKSTSFDSLRCVCACVYVCMRFGLLWSSPHYTTVVTKIHTVGAKQSLHFSIWTGPFSNGTQHGEKASSHQVHAGIIRLLGDAWHAKKSQYLQGGGRVELKHSGSSLYPAGSSSLETKPPSATARQAGRAAAASNPLPVKEVCVCMWGSWQAGWRLLYPSLLPT